MYSKQNQNRVFFSGFALIVLVIAWFLVRPFIFRSKEAESRNKEQKINEEIVKASSATAQEIFQKTRDKSKIFILDISNPSDFGRGHIETSINVEVGKINADTLGLLGIQKTSDVIIAGRGDDLESVAPLVNRLVNFGFVNCKYLQGGISNWMNLGYPLISSESSSDNNPKVKKIAITEIEKDSEMNPDIIQFLDIRSKDDFSHEHIIRAVNIPFADIETKKDEIPAAKKIIIYAGNESESFRAASILFDLNFFSAYQMEGDLEDWKSAGGKTESGS